MCQKANQDFSISGEFPYSPWVFLGSAKNEDLFLLWHQMGPKKTQFYCRSGGDSVTFKVILPAPSEEELTLYGDNHWKWLISGGPFSGANETREFIIESLGATRKGGVETGMTQEWHLL